MMRAKAGAAAHRGTTEWLVQRISSLYLAGFVVAVALYFSLSPAPDYAAWRTWFGSGPIRIAWALFFASLLAHAWVGLRSVYMDYLHPLWLRFTATALTAFALLALGLWAAEILWLAGS